MSLNFVSQAGTLKAEGATILSIRLHETNPLQLSPLSCLVAMSAEAEKPAKETFVGFADSLVKYSMCGIDFLRAFGLASANIRKL